MRKDVNINIAEDKIKCDLIEKLLANTILPEELMVLREKVDATDLSFILQKIYDLNETYIFRLAAVEGMLKKLNRIKNEQRNAKFFKKINKGFRVLGDKSRMIVLVEGDSWFNYPVILTDTIDRISMDKDLAVYSIASGGDWLLNMLNGREYIEELSISRPDWFLISGGGNDLVGSRRLAAILQPDGGSTEFQKNQWAQDLITNAEKKHVPLSEDFFHGLEYLSKDFYALLMFFHLQFHFLFTGILKGGGNEPKFEGIRIITQGYDFPIPSFSKRFGINPAKWYVPFIRLFLGHGSWLEGPLQIRGINNSENQRKVLYAMIYLFNEMMIEMGSFFNNDPKLPNRVYHIDSRDSVGANGWADELHPKPAHFIKTGKTFINCIKQNRQPDYGHVYVVKKCNP